MKAVLAFIHTSCRAFWQRPLVDCITSFRPSLAEHTAIPAPASTVGRDEFQRELNYLLHLVATGLGGIKAPLRERRSQRRGKEIVARVKYFEGAHVGATERVDDELGEHGAFDARALEHRWVFG